MSTENSKAAVILARCAILGPATAVFKIMHMYRKITHKLIEWKNSSDRPPLIIVGARQVGKTYAIKEFGASEFRAVHVFNFEENPKLSLIFNQDLKTTRILRELSFFTSSEIDPNSDLIFFDEIQACPKAITALKYLRENSPNLAVCAAGSLLGVSISEESFPVGQVQFYYMQPLDFEEFLSGTKQERELMGLRSIVNGEIRSEIPHDTLWSAMLDYFVIGGMPKVVKQYSDNLAQQRAPFTKIRELQRDIITSYRSDFSKHAGKVNAHYIRSVFDNVPLQNARAIDASVGRFRFNEVSDNLRGYSRLKGPIDWLVNAGLLNKVKIANRSEVPLEAFCSENIFKLYLFDVGILGCALDLSERTIVADDYGISKGYFAESFVCQELSSSAPYRKNLYSWSEGQSELEFLKVVDNSIIPIEVKAGRRLQAKSLTSFRKRYSPPISVKLSKMHLHYDDKNKILLVPLYLAGLLDQLLHKTDAH